MIACLTATATGHAAHDCKPAMNRTGLPKASPSQALTSARLLWQQAVIGRYGMAYSGWQYAKSKQTACRSLDKRTPQAGPYRCVVMGTPCRAHP